MCLLVVQKPNTKMSNKKISNAWDSNSDGSGYSFSKDGKIITKKYMDLKSFKSNFNSDWNSNKDKTFLIHFRYATHGLKNVSNVHPFKVNENLVFAHNGIINCVEDDNKLSDTQMFNKEVLQKLDKSFLKNDVQKLLIENSIGSSKLAFLDSNGHYTIINESDGHWNENNSIWYSNDGYKRSTIYVSGGNFNGYNFNRNQESFKFNNVKYADNEWLRCEWCKSESDETHNFYNQQLCVDCYDSQTKYMD